MTSLKKVLLALLLLATACKNPTQDLKIVVDTNIIKYSALIRVTDASAAGAVPKNVTMTISGSNAADFYEISGKKNFKLTGGVIAIGPGPSAVPTAGKPDTCVINIKAPGYITVLKPIIFTADQKQQVVAIRMQKAGSSPTSLPPVVPPPVYDAVSLNFTGFCKSRSDVQLRPSMYVFYRITGSGSPFEYLGYIDEGNISVTALAEGKSYDFQVTYGGQNYVVSQLIEQSSYNLQIDMGTSCNDF